MTAPTTGARHATAVAGTLSTAFIWGASFAAMKYTLQAGLSVGAMLTLRFAIGSACLGVFLLLLRIRPTWPAVRDGLVLGLFLTVIFWLQAGGLATTTTTKSGFITGLYVLFTPVASLVLGHRLRIAHGLGALVATGGLFLLVRTPGASFGGWNQGDSLTLACAVGCGFHIAFTGIFSRRSSGWILAFVQVATLASISLVVTAFLPAPYGFQTARKALAAPGVWVSLLYLGILATSLAFWLMSTLQAHLGSTEAAILYSLEPVFTALLAMTGWIPGIREHLSPTQLLGGAVILGAMILAEVGPRWMARFGDARPELDG
ncbi:MAG TPA: DMT family transporter [Holophaga sp.]|nr:DMT family transporter [Holophaga sp.]